MGQIVSHAWNALFVSTPPSKQLSTELDTLMLVTSSEVMRGALFAMYNHVNVVNGHLKGILKKLEKDNLGDVKIISEVLQQALTNFQEMKTKLFEKFENHSDYFPNAVTLERLQQLQTMINAHQADQLAKTYMFTITMLERVSGDKDPELSTVLKQIIDSEDNHEVLKDNIFAYKDELTEFNKNNTDKPDFCAAINDLINYLEPQMPQVQQLLATINAPTRRWME